jgi:hypothetical protein
MKQKHNQMLEERKVQHQKEIELKKQEEEEALKQW